MRICEDCGAHLDAGEKCDCEKEKAPLELQLQRAHGKNNIAVSIQQHEENVKRNMRASYDL